jgi:hypothetical protein
MRLREFIERSVREYLKEEQMLDDDIKNILIKRIPFLKEYNIFKHQRDEKRLEAQRVIYNENVKFVMGDEIVNFPRFGVTSNIWYYTNDVYDNTFHHFIIKNKFGMKKPEEMDELTYRVFIIGMKGLGENLSYSKEIRLKNNEEIPKKELDKIINDMNGTLFKIEEFTEKHSINLF